MKLLPIIFTTSALFATLHGGSLPAVTLEKGTIEGLDISSAPVGQDLVADPITATAQIIIDPTRTRSIATFFSGHLDRDLVQPGDQVRAGQALAHFKSREVAEVISKFIEADSKLETATLLYERERGLRPKKLTTEDDFLAAKAAYQEALATRTATMQVALLARTKDDLLTLREGDGIHDLTELPIISPLSGTIIKKSAYPGDAVESNTELFEIADLGQLLIEIQIPLKAASFVKVGDSLDFHTVVGNKRNGTARIARISPVVNQGALSVRVFATLKNTKSEWLVGTPVNVDVLDSAAQKVTGVPTTSIVTIEGSPHLFVEEAGGRFQPLAITTGESSQSFTEVTVGLPADARVVVKGASLLLAAWEERAAE
jgi:cobalt-zinc-cadmium efflux system membrane fusion protein